MDIFICVSISEERQNEFTEFPSREAVTTGAGKTSNTTWSVTSIVQPFAPVIVTSKFLVKLVDVPKFVAGILIPDNTKEFPEPEVGYPIVVSFTPSIDAEIPCVVAKLILWLKLTVTEISEDGQIWVGTLVIVAVGESIKEISRGVIYGTLPLSSNQTPHFLTLNRNSSLGLLLEISLNNTVTTLVSWPVTILPKFSVSKLHS